MILFSIFRTIVLNTLYIWEKSWGDWLWNKTVGKQIAKSIREDMIKSYAVAQIMRDAPTEKDALKDAIKFILLDMGVK